MMAAVPFDTLKMVERLEKAGVPAEQARVQTDLLVEIMQAEDASLTERFSAKRDVTSELTKMNYEMTSFRQENKAELHRLEQTLLTKIANASSENTRWIVSVGILQGALIAALVLKLVH